MGKWSGGGDRRIERKERRWRKKERGREGIGRENKKRREGCWRRGKGEQRDKERGEMKQ